MWYDTSGALSRDVQGSASSLVELWEDSRRRFADRTALVGSRHRLTYAEAGEQIDEAAAILSDMGVSKGTKIALFLHNDPGFVVAFFSVLKAGGVACLIDPQLSLRELSRVLSMLRPDLAILGDLARRQQERLPQVPTVEMDGHRLKPLRVKILPREPEAELRDVAGLFCTSGTTGAPKAVMLSHDNLTSNTLAFREHGAWTEHEVFGNPLPVWHISGAMVLSLVPISMGATVVFLPRATPEAILKTVERERITRFGGVPHIYATLNRFHHADDYDVESCRSWITGGAPLPQTVEAEFERKFNRRICHVYGMLEASPGIASTLDGRSYPIGVVGRPLPRVKVEIRDASGAVLGDGQDGQVWVHSPGVMRGYYHDPEGTARTVRNGWLDTGDIGHLGPDGALRLSGRHKETMIVAGHNVYPTEIETVLLEDPMISDAAVAALQDEVRGEEVIAFAVPASNAKLAERDILARCRQVLVPYKVPRRVFLVDAIPRNETGKILRKALLEIVDLKREN